MKKKLLMGMLMFALAVGMTACGAKEPADEDTKVEESQEKDTEEKDIEEKEEKQQEEKKEEKKEEQKLPNWVGVQDRVGRTVDGIGSYAINIEYPSLKPATTGCAYQKDPALVLVKPAGKDSNGEYVQIENVEDTLMLCKYNIDQEMQAYRGYDCTDFKFDITTQEVMTFNDMPTCFYEGTHSYVKGGETISVPFVAYSFYTGQIENYSYFTLLVIDDSVNQYVLDPLPEGTIQAYAKKMMESIIIK